MAFGGAGFMGAAGAALPKCMGAPLFTAPEAAGPARLRSSRFSKIMTVTVNSLREFLSSDLCMTARPT